MSLEVCFWEGVGGALVVAEGGRRVRGRHHLVGRGVERCLGSCRERWGLEMVVGVGWVADNLKMKVFNEILLRETYFRSKMMC